MKVLYICVLSFTLLKPTQAQIRFDSLLLTDRVNYLTNAYQTTYRKIEFHHNSIKWDTASAEFSLYLSKVDTIRVILGEETKERIRVLQNLLTENDYNSFKLQVVNQRNIKPLKRIVKGNKKSKKNLIVFFSKPILSVDNKYIILREKFRENPSSFLTSSYDLTTLYEISNKGIKTVIHIFGTSKSAF